MSVFSAIHENAAILVLTLASPLRTASNILQLFHRAAGFCATKKKTHFHELRHTFGNCGALARKTAHFHEDGALATKNVPFWDFGALVEFNTIVAWSSLCDAHD